MKLELPSFFQPSEKLNGKLKAGKKLQGFVSHKSLAETIVQTKIGRLTLPVADVGLSKGQQVVVFKDAEGRMFLDTSPSNPKSIFTKEIPVDTLRLEPLHSIKGTVSSLARDEVIVQTRSGKFVLPVNELKLVL